MKDYSKFQWLTDWRGAWLDCIIEFFKIILIIALMISTPCLLIVDFISGTQEGLNKVCFEAYLNKVHLNNCDDSKYPVKEKL